MLQSFFKPPNSNPPLLNPTRYGEELSKHVCQNYGDSGKDEGMSTEEVSDMYKNVFAPFHGDKDFKIFVGNNHGKDEFMEFKQASQEVIKRYKNLKICDIFDGLSKSENDQDNM